MPFLDFTAGDVLTAANVDTMFRQGVMTFADASARDTALTGVLDEGMVCFLEDVNSFLFYTGSAWQPLSTQWTTFTPSWTNLTVGNGTVVGRYRYTQGDMDIRVSVAFGSTTSISGLPSFLLPESKTSTADGIRSLGTTWYIDYSGTHTVGTCQTDSGSSGVSLYTSALAPLSATAPFTWATSDTIDLNISVRVV